MSNSLPRPKNKEWISSNSVEVSEEKYSGNLSDGGGRHDLFLHAIEFKKTFQVSKYRETLMPMCMAMLKYNHADADDAVGQTMIAFANQSDEQLDRIENKGAWLKRVARNACISLLRRKQLAARFISPVNVDDVSAAEEVGRRLGTPHVESAEEALMRRQLRQVIFAGLQAMPYRQRQAFERRFLHDQSYAQIALAIRTSEPNARKLIQKAREFLRDYIRQNYR